MFDRLFGNRPSDPATADRVPPGQYLTEKFPVLHYGSVPKTDLATWDFKVYGDVDNPMTLNWAEFQALPRKQVTTDIHCVTRWSKLDTHWEGVAIQTILELAQVRPTARFVVGHAEQGYTANLPLDVLDDDDVLLADTYDGAPLEPDHGYPLRLIVPKRYFWKGPKWIRGLELTTAGPPGLLGALRLPQRRRPLERGAVQFLLSPGARSRVHHRVGCRGGELVRPEGQFVKALACGAAD